MNIRNIKFIESEAFENKINIKLCNELINFIYETSSNKSKDILDDIIKKCIWFRKNKILEIKNIYDRIFSPVEYCLGIEQRRPLSLAKFGFIRTFLLSCLITLKYS